MTRESVAAEVESATAGRISAQQFLDASANASAYASAYPFLSSAGENSLEGYLFPKTYAITAVDDATSVVYMMLNQFRDETAGLDVSYPESMDMTWYDIVKLASIVQKEGARSWIRDSSTSICRHWYTPPTPRAPSNRGSNAARPSDGLFS